ncbi:MAG: phosphoglucomutase [FCB group bacterium]|nr:phosphoglucomutase [FCB group bacterium]
MKDLNLSMFRAYDIRTPSALLSDTLSERLAWAEAAYFRDVLRAEGVVIARDARSSGPRYLEQAAEIYARAGLNVTVIPQVASTCMFYFTAMSNPHCAGVMIGASHNPAGDTGRKIVGLDARPIAENIGPEGGLNRIRELYLQDARTAGKRRGRIVAHDPTDEYIEYSLELADFGGDDLSGLRLFQDYLNGAAGREMMLAFDIAGADLTPMHFAADGSFPLGDPNPVKQDSIAPGLEVLKAGNFRCGMFFDGDGDRIDFYRGDGAYLSSSFVYAALLPEIRRRFEGSNMGVFACLKCNPLALMEMAHAGVSTSIIRNGHSQIKSAMSEDPCRFGTVEESAHFYEAFTMEGQRYCLENTLYIALLAARVWHRDPARFDRLFEIQARTAREREWGYKFPGDDERAAALDAVEAYFVAQGAQSKNHMDNGYDLEATIMRRGLPFEVTTDTHFAPDWLQVCQRVSQSENGLARWEVVAAEPALASEAKAAIAEIVAHYGAGNEYQG